ncbi:glycoside hydrolase family 3 C-terminal domain-containing protein [Vibrio tritonius]|uniref:glycoside hydrolase family 3 C-terminal domain-containing protein n=1 Tax=Vibrio tritonius TaxID=1435069 RepID=UPI00315D3817
MECRNNYRLNSVALAVGLGLVMGLSGCSSTPAETDQAAREAAQKMVSNMTMDEKLNILVGPGYHADGINAKNKVQGTAGYINGVNNPAEEINLPAVVLADGPAGIRIDANRKDDSSTYHATAFPVGVLLASTWDTKLAEKVAESVGQEAKAYGVDFWLAPGMNIQRNPLNGRNFEYYSEDPLVTAKIAEAITDGVQKEGVGVTIKHLVANNSETNRFNVDNIISPRALREIYLRGFEDTVETAQPWAIMSSYNKVNGEFTSQRRDLLTDVLRNEWGFRGLVMSDWFAGDNSVDMINAGNDAIQPGGVNLITKEDHRAALEKGVKDGSLKESDINLSVERIVTQMLKVPAAEQQPLTNQPNLDKHAIISRMAAEEGMILLKNQDNALPLQTKQSVAMFGIAQQLTQKGGTGSGDVHPDHLITITQGMSAEFNLDQDLMEEYQSWYLKKRVKHTGKFGISTTYSCNEPRLTSAQFTQAAKDNQSAVVTISRMAGEGTDRQVRRADYLLTHDETRLIKNVSQAFHAVGKKVIVVLNIPGVIDTSWSKHVDGIVLAYMPGEEAGYAVANVLSGKTNPSGKLTQTFPLNYSDVPSAKSFFGQDTDGDKQVDTNYYNEGIMVGYRYYTTANKPVAYPFGYGLSYTQFHYDNAHVKGNTVNNVGASGSVSLSATIENTGESTGKEVAEVYIKAPQGKLVKPAIELKAFAKTEALEPGQKETLSFTIPAKWLASFDDKANQWVIEPGQYQAYIAPSSDITGIKPLNFSVKKTVIVANTTPNALALPKGYKEDNAGGVVIK